MLFRNREERRAERMEKRIAKEKLRAEEDIIESLIKGVEKTNWISHETQANNEIYRLDVMDISLDMVKKSIVVTDKMGGVLASVDCAYDAFSDAQQKKNMLFSALLNGARIRNEQEEKKVKMQKATSKINATKHANEQRQEIEAIKQSALKIKSL